MRVLNLFLLTAAASTQGALTKDTCIRAIFTPVMSCPTGSVIVGREMYSGNPICHTEGYPDVQLNSIVISPPDLPVGYALYRISGGWKVVAISNKVGF